MSIFEEFKFQYEMMRRKIDPDKEYIRMDVAGLEAHQIVRRPSREGTTIIVAGEDEAGKPAVVVMPEGHFYGELTVDNKKKDRLVTGFSIEKGKDAESSISN